ncbi:cation transporter [Tenacibaculum agarivorans]|uniref:cation transporter n=1 Tax=Tenacibaculum agarivorans TaxID=1908389 RepID=UPI00094B81B3|nr:cation transporter [Tenacibaculum agarivorans]
MEKILVITSIILIIASCNRIGPEKRVLNVSEKDSVFVMSIPKAGCKNCQKVIEGGLAKVKGVKQTILNLNSKEVSIAYNPEDTNSKILKNKVTKLAQNIPCK